MRLDCSEERKELLFGAEDVLIALANGDARAGAADCDSGRMMT